MTCYSHPAVRARIAEFLGMEPGCSKPTCVFLTIGDEHAMDYHEHGKRASYRLV